MLNFFRPKPPAPLIEPSPSPAERAAARRSHLRSALAAVEPDDIITLVSHHFYDRADVVSLRDLSRTSDRAADLLERNSE